ncbi:hybrid sensor histidine kinase/response regulator [Geomonas oryzisoli]|uniref:histidine kinase n=1 Tax=Geomonas oryzisoli TaxID=2847992 RepID=A0ABX8JI76_9BACT|nr:hybrid sensor histidine kinase/response regulator [Geomonas oryzisoli]QWV95175.1 hybrid sensor histidine kinase/response regulator [Geomonas oryzisoli]
MESIPISSRTSDILIVDDQPANLQVLSEILKSNGFKVRPVPSGRLALGAAEKEPPDLILLDIMMPEMDGYELCRRLKEMPLLSHIPVIFISALDETVDKIAGFRAGGVDYIAKPFEAEEVLARVRAHLALRQYQDSLQEQNRLIEQNYDRLQELEKMRDQLTHMIVHDMRNLLTGVGASLLMLQKDLAEKLDDRSNRLLNSAAVCARELSDMCNNLLDVSKLEENQMQLNLSECGLLELSRAALEKLRPVVQNRSVSIPPANQELLVFADRDILLRIIFNLLHNALKFTDSDGVIAIALQGTEALVRYSVTDNGPGIPCEFREKIFQKFGQVNCTKYKRNLCSTGLGLTFCKLAAEAHHGRIWVESEAGVGSTFHLELPINREHP